MAKSELLTLTEVSKRTGISMPTLQRYKKLYQDRIPSEGEGRKQRYPTSSLRVFEEIKKENIKRRGRPARKKSSGGGAKAGNGRRKAARGRKSAAGSKATGRKAGGRRKAAAGSGSASTSGLLSLTEVGKRTGISYPTLSRYVKLHGDKIPSEGKGRKRRYHPEAVEVFNELRSQSRRGGGRRKGSGRKAGAGRKAAAAGGTDATLARRIQSLEQSVRELKELVKRPIKVTLGR